MPVSRPGTVGAKGAVKLGSEAKSRAVWGASLVTQQPRRLSLWDEDRNARLLFPYLVLAWGNGVESRRLIPRAIVAMWK